MLEEPPSRPLEAPRRSGWSGRRARRPPGRVMANLKTGGMRELLGAAGQRAAGAGQRLTGRSWRSARKTARAPEALTSIDEVGGGEPRPEVLDRASRAHGGSEAEQPVSPGAAPSPGCCRAAVLRGRGSAPPPGIAAFAAQPRAMVTALARWRPRRGVVTTALTGGYIELLAAHPTYVRLLQRAALGGSDRLGRAGPNLEALTDALRAWRSPRGPSPTPRGRPRPPTAAGERPGAVLLPLRPSDDAAGPARSRCHRPSGRARARRRRRAVAARPRRSERRGIDSEHRGRQ